MSKEFFDLYERQAQLALDVGHNSIADWCIVIYDTKGVGLAEAKAPAIQVQECTVELAFAKAYVKLCEYLSDKRGGY
jgi:hypothetical protein